MEEIVAKGMEESMAKNKVGKHILKLIQEKTVPLNKMRFEHLQKISKALNKPVPLAYTSAMQLSLCLEPRHSHQQLPSCTKVKSNRSSALAAADVLISRLKNVQELKPSKQLDLRDEQTIQRWDNLRSNIAASEKVSSSVSRITSNTVLVKHSQQNRRKRQDLLELAERAQRYLRQKKHDLKERYCRQEEYNNNGRQKKVKPSQIEVLLTTLKGKLPKSVTNEQIEKQLLRDIRDSMMEVKLVRLKKDINHKKIVQMR